MAQRHPNPTFLDGVRLYIHMSSCPVRPSKHQPNQNLNQVKFDPNQIQSLYLSGSTKLNKTKLKGREMSLSLTYYLIIFSRAAINTVRVWWCGSTKSTGFILIHAVSGSEEPGQGQLCRGGHYRQPADNPSLCSAPLKVYVHSVAQGCKICADM